MTFYINTNIVPSKNSNYGIRKVQNIENISDKQSPNSLNSIQEQANYSQSNRSFDAQIRGNDTSLRNANDAISMVQIADQAISQIIDNVQEIKRLLNQSSTDSSIQIQIDDLTQEISNIIDTTQFDGHYLLKNMSNRPDDANDINLKIGFGGVQEYPFHFVNANLDGYLGMITHHSFKYNDTEFKQSALDNSLHYLTEQEARYDAIQSRFEGMIYYAQQPNQHKSKVLNSETAQQQVETIRVKLLEFGTSASISSESAYSLITQ